MQDAYYWPLTPSKCVTVWVAIADIDEDNGPMQFVPGSHLHGPSHHNPSDPDEHNVLNHTVPEPGSWGDGSVTTISPLRAGQASLHSDLLLHSSDALLVALDDKSSAANCTQPSTAFGKPGYGYDFSQVDASAARLTSEGFAMAGLRCAPGRTDPWDGTALPFSAPRNGDCICPAGEDPPCACACGSPGEDFVVAGCELAATVRAAPGGAAKRPWRFPM